VGVRQRPEHLLGRSHASSAQLECSLAYPGNTQKASLRRSVKSIRSGLIHRHTVRRCRAPAVRYLRSEAQRPSSLLPCAASLGSEGRSGSAQL